MTLQEAFMARNDLRKKISRVSGDLNSVIITEEGEDCVFNAKEKLAELESLQDDIYDLNVRIDHANKINVERLQKLKTLDEKIKDYNNFRSILLSWKRTRTMGFTESTTVIMKKNLDLDEISNRLESLEKERRDLDKEIQKINWTTEI